MAQKKVDSDKDDKLLAGGDLEEMFSAAGVLHRKKLKSLMTNAEMDSMFKFHNKAQEDISENILRIARSLKEQSVTAGSIIREDIKTIEKSKSLTDKNVADLIKNNEMLQAKTKQAWQWGIWLLVFVVFTVFISMIFLMKIMKKH